MAPDPLFNWLSDRGAGVLLHPTALPGPHGIGSLGGSGRFLELLEAARMQYWQICPLGPTGFGDSPYQCFSAFAGNPNLIDLEELEHHELLQVGELAPLAALPADRVDFGALYRRKWPLLELACERYHRAGAPSLYGDYRSFCHAHAGWLEDYARFRALKDLHEGRPWWEWPESHRRHESAGSPASPSTYAARMDLHLFTQYVFFGQWARMRAAAGRHGVTIIGDLPIFVAADSADVWAHPELFELDPASGRPAAVAGVPPDYFAADGQLWGNPLYRWDRHAADGYAWWQRRLESAFDWHDIVRIDHFRGFDQYWRIPLPADNARHGAWKPGPGLDFFRAIQAQLPGIRIIAEDLGQFSPSVGKLLADTGLPGMAVLQFAFGGDATNSHLPHNLKANSVVYPGTHDNDTSLGWYREAKADVQDHVRRYLRIDGNEIAWDLIRTCYAAVSRIAIIPFQDILNLGSEARFNRPGQPEGNWQWRCRPEMIEARFEDTAPYLAGLAELYGR